MSHNRASYQRHNPNMSIHKTPKPKRPVLLFKDSGGNTALLELSEKHIKRLSRLFPSETSTQILINLLNGRAYYLPMPVDQYVTLIFK